MHRHFLPLTLVAVLVVALLGGTGCGVNYQDFIYNSVSATGRSLIDVFLTDLANNLAGAAENANDNDGEDNENDNDGDGNVNDNEGGDNENDNDGGGPPDGAALYADNCSACHGPNGNDGFAPDITGLSAEDLTAGLELGVHAGVAELSAEEVAAIATFLGG